MTRLGRSPPLVRQSMYDGLSSYYTLFIRIHRLSCQVCMLFLSARWRPTLPRRCSRVLSLERTGSRLRQRGTAGFFRHKNKNVYIQKMSSKTSNIFIQKISSKTNMVNYILPTWRRFFIGEHNPTVFFFGSSNDSLLYLKS